MKQTSQRSLLFRQNVNRTESDRRRVCPRHGGRGMRTRLCPRRRAVDRAAMRSDGNHFRQLALRRKVAWDVRIVGSCSLKMVGPIYVNNCLFHFCHKMQGASTFRQKPPRRIGRASRVEYNPLTGSVGILPNIISWRNGVWRQRRENVIDNHIIPSKNVIR